MRRTLHEQVRAGRGGRAGELHRLADIGKPVPGIQLMALNDPAVHGRPHRHATIARLDIGQHGDQVGFELVHMRGVRRVVHINAPRA